MDLVVVGLGSADVAAEVLALEVVGDVAGPDERVGGVDGAGSMVPPPSEQPVTTRPTTRAASTGGRAWWVGLLGRAMPPGYVLVDAVASAAVGGQGRVGVDDEVACGLDRHCLQPHRDAVAVGHERGHGVAP